MKTNLSILIAFLFFFSCGESNSDKTDNKTKETSHTSEMTFQNIIPCYVGTYTRPEGHVNGQAEGIYRVDLNTETGEFSNKKIVAKLINPSFIKLSPDKKYLYAVSELAHADEPTGFLYAYKVTPYSLEFINKLPTDGQAPCHLGMDKTGEFLFVSNYLKGITKSYQRQNDGSIKDFQTIDLQKLGQTSTQKESNLHSLQFSPDNQIAAIADKGKDKVWLFKNDNGKLIPHEQSFVSIQEGAGPRHLVWSKDGLFIYVINELDNTINVIKNERSKFESIQSITTISSKNYNGESFCADIHLHPDGKYLYGSNRGHNSIAMYKVNMGTGKLTSLGQESTRGEYPRNFSIHPNRYFLFVANQNSNNITTYKIDQKTGLLEFTGLDFKIETPVCIEY